MSLPLHHHHHHHHRSTSQLPPPNPNPFLSPIDSTDFDFDSPSLTTNPPSTYHHLPTKPELLEAGEAPPQHHYPHHHQQYMQQQPPPPGQPQQPPPHDHLSLAYSHHPLQHLLVAPSAHYGAPSSSTTMPPPLLHSPYHQEELTPHEDIPLFTVPSSPEREDDDEQEEEVEDHHHHHHRSSSSGSGGLRGELSGTKCEEEEEGEVVRLWGCDWRRQTSKDGKSVLVTVLPNENDYESYMKQFDDHDHDKGFYWVTDRGRKYSKATTTTMQRMRWKDTFNCFFGRRHSKKGGSEEAMNQEDGDENASRGGKKKRSRASQKLYCPASLSATCVMDGTVELRYYDNHVDHSLMGPPPRRKRQEERSQRRMKLLQNEHLSAWRTVIKPGQPPKLHRHDKDRLVYVLKGGRLKVVGENNKVKKIYNLEADKAYWFPRDPPGELHGDVNEGTENIIVLVVEVEDRQSALHLPTPVMHFG